MYDPLYSPDDVQAAHLDALMAAMLHIQRVLKDRTAKSRDVAAALKALAQVTLALQRQRPPEQAAQLSGYAPHEIHAAVADLVREHDGPELRALLGRGSAVITGEED